MERTTITCSVTTRDRLQARKRGGESYNDVLKRLMEAEDILNRLQERTDVEVQA